MSPLVLLMNFSKVVGVASILTVAANVLTYRRFRKKNLSPFMNPIDESQEVLAAFPIDKDVDDGGFFFGLATAPAHVEDKLNDAWVEFAKETPPKDEDDGAPGEQLQEVRGSDIQEGNSSDQDTMDISYKDEGCENSKETTKNQVELIEQTQEIPERLEPHLMDEWEMINKGQEKVSGDTTKNLDSNISFISQDEEVSRGADQKESASTEIRPEPMQNVPVDQSVLRRSKSTIEEPMLQYNFPRKGRKLVKVAMEAMIRGFEKFVEDDQKINVAAWHNVPYPEERLRFWSDPDIELQLAQATNISVFRMGIDWNRLMPVEPIDGIQNSVNWAALDRYRLIIEKVRARGMRVMLTLFHHSLPKWAGAYGGWKLEKTVDYFLEFTRLSVEKFADLVDFWITFNEPHVFAMLTYCAGAWPGGHPDLLETATAVLPRGVFKQAMRMMALAHLRAYDLIHLICNKKTKKTKVGVSHHVSFMRPFGLFDVPAVVFSDWMTRFTYIDDICYNLDFIGINYYGQEVVSAPGLKLVPNDEYSESGRGVYPDGLYRILLDFHNRYRKFNLPYIITENGISDETDTIRRPYILEHLLAIKAAMIKGVPVQGYCFWTTSDNWEWADGYGPKFGLVAVDRENNLARIPRPSYHLFAEIARTGKVTREQRDKAWVELEAAAAEGKKRPFFRAVDKNGLMYAGGLDVPIERPFVQRDWRFGHYEPDNLQDPLSQVLRFIIHIPAAIRANNSKRQGRIVKVKQITSGSSTHPLEKAKGSVLETDDEKERKVVLAGAFS